MANYNLTQTGDEVQAYIDSIPVIDVTGTLSGSVVVFTTNPYPQVAANYEAGCGSIIRLTVGEDIHLIPITHFDGIAYKGSTMTGWNNVVATIKATSASAIVAISGIDDAPTAGSRNPVTSTGINTSLQNLNNSINGSLQTLQNEIDSIQPIVIEGNITNAPDEEDITTDSEDLLKFKNRVPGLNQLGYFILRRDQTFAAQVTEANTIYEIRYEFDLNGGSVTIPSGCVLKFNGGSLKNGTISGNGTAIISERKKIFYSLNISGVWNTPFYVEYYGCVGDGITDDSTALNAAFSSFVGQQNKVDRYSTNITPTLIAESSRGYYLSQTITSSSININFNGTIFIYSGNGACFNFSEIWLSNVNIGSIYHTGSTHWSNSNLCALKIDAAQRCRFSINLISYFRYGIIAMASDNKEFYSNFFKLNAFYYTMKCFTIITQGSGWANHNYVEGGISDYLTGELYDTTEVRYLIGVESVGNNTPNSWSFINNGIEGGYVADTTNSHFVNSFYLYVAPAARIIGAIFENGRIEGINNLQYNSLIGNASSRLRFVNALYEKYICRHVLSDVANIELVNGEEYQPRTLNYDSALLFSYNYKDFLQHYSGSSRTSNCQPAPPFLPNLIRCKNQRFTEIKTEGNTLMLDVRGRSFLLHKQQGSRMHINFWDDDEMALGGSAFRSNIETYTGIEYPTLHVGSAFYWVYSDNGTYIDTWGDYGDSELSIIFKIPESSPIRYMSFRDSNGVSSYNIYKLDASPVITPFKKVGEPQETPAASNSWNNINISLMKGHRYRFNYGVPHTIICTNDGMFSSLRDYIIQVTATTTAGSNIVSIDKYASYFWVGGKIWINNVMCTIYGVDTTNLKLTVDVVFNSAYSGLITAPTADYMLEQASFTTAELTTLKTLIVANKAVGSMVYNSDTNKPVWWNGSNWVDATGTTT